MHDNTKRRLTKDELFFVKTGIIICIGLLGLVLWPVALYYFGINK